MSDILIKGMEMPTACYECRMYQADIYYCSAAERDIDIPNSSEGRCSFCPLVPVPKHGRRVVYRGDVYNAIEEKRIKTLDRVLNDRYIEGMHDGLKQALFALATVEDATTIIPAEEGE